MKQAPQGELVVAGTRLEVRTIAGARPPTAGGGGSTLVFLHEGLGCADLWRTFPRRLAAATGLDAFVYSRVGYGRSDPVMLPRPLDYHDREAAALADVLDAAGIGRAILIGHSDGGTIALLHAALDRDQRVAGVVSIAAHAMVEEVTLEGIRQAQRAYETGDLRRRLAFWHGSNVDGAFRGWCDTWTHPDFRGWCIADRLAEITQPVFVVQGERDQYGSVAQIDAITSGVGGRCDSLVLAGCGHAPHDERPEDLLADVTAFAVAVDAAAPTAAERRAAVA